MRIVVIADAHGAETPIMRALDAQRTAEAAIFLGDGIRQFEEAAACFPDLRTFAVRGNCDFGSDAPGVQLITLDGIRIFATHGHGHYVKDGMYQFISAARDAKASIALYGHTHVARCEYDDGLYIMNPGSVWEPRSGPASYGVIDITPAGIVTNIVEF